MSWWQRLWRKPSSASQPERLRVVTLTLDGWTEEAATGQLMLFVPGDEVADVWTIVSAERGTTGIREAIVTAQLLSVTES